LSVRRRFKQLTTRRSAAVALLRGTVFVCLCAPFAISQIRQINSSKLPQDSAVQHTYTDLQSIEQYARTNDGTWHSPIPRADVASRLSVALTALQVAQQQAPGNKELQLYTGLIAHLAYNLGIEQGANPAVNLLQPLAAEDFRAAWFLGIHQCQSLDSVGGMRQLLRVETTSTSLPSTFWQDYAVCAGITKMPVHAVRAYDNAHKTPDGLPIDERLEQIARDRIKPSNNTSSYSPRQSWYGEKTDLGIRSTSNVCGESFLTRPTFHIKLGDVRNGMCIVTMDTDLYPSRYGPSSASLMLLTQAAKPGESLDAFAQRVLKDQRYANNAPLTGIQCPVATCLSFEVVTDKLYKPEGGLHLLAVFFQSEQPAYPGLRFESPQPLHNAPNIPGEASYFRPLEIIQRFNGTLYTIVTLDANHDNYPRSRSDFDELLKSLVIDTK
jgi:hypothetical protein